VPVPARLQDFAVMQVFYVHGFASSASSKKASFFADRLRPHGIHLRCPDLNEPDFSTLTVTRMIERMGIEIRAADRDPAVLIGSSLGAFVSVLAAERFNRERPGSISHLVLLAPALDFGGNRMRHLGEDGLTRWRETGRLDVFHYGYGRTMPVGYALYDDATKYDALGAGIEIPMLIFQGRRDESVDAASVERFAHDRSNVTLYLLDDGHQLLDSLEFIWRETAGFLGLAPGVGR
jgi:pimeloyl-ACP methyl ester carboxylesterase